MKKYLWILAAVVALVACGKNEKPGVTPVVTDAVSVAPTSLSFTADGTQTESVTVTASGAWTSAKSASWITVNPSSGNGNATVTVSAAFNGGDTRTGKVTFKVGAASAELSVSQSADSPAEETAVVPAPATFDGTKRSNTAYQLLIYSFADSDGDGVGDFKGIQNKLDYLDEMGITALWLSPAHPTSSYHAYDVNDYYALNPLYAVGEKTEAKAEQDFKSLLAAAHAKGIAIYMDYVLNHSGKNNAWFQEALANPDSKYRNYYFFSTNPSADYSKFPMLTGTTYQSGEWKKTTSGAPQITITQTEDAVKSGNAKWNLWFWKDGGNGSAIKFVDNGDGTYYTVVEMNGKYGMLVRPEDNWNSKFGAVSGTSPVEGTPYQLVADGADIFFTGSGRYKIELSNVSTQTLYYMGCFSDWMPDLNYGNVNEAQNNPCFQDLAASADKWINMGVDGLRLDAVKHICGGINSYNNTSNITLLGKWYDHCNATYKAAGKSLGQTTDIFMVAEAWDGHNIEKTYYKGLTSCFEFDYGYKVSDMLNGTNASGFVSAVAGYVSDHTAQRSDATTSFFLSNHDQNRFASNVNKKTALIKQAGAILLSGPGKPFIYQGEELGYYGTKDGGDEYVRTPMLWDKAKTECAKKGVENKVDESMLTTSISVEAQKDNAESVLNVYKTWSRLRNTYEALASGTMTSVNLAGANTIAAWYMTSSSGQKLLVIHNVAPSAKSVTLSDDLSKPIALLGTASVAGRSLKLGANSSVVFQL